MLFLLIILFGIIYFLHLNDKKNVFNNKKENQFDKHKTDKIKNNNKNQKRPEIKQDHKLLERLTKNYKTKMGKYIIF